MRARRNPTAQARPPGETGREAGEAVRHGRTYETDTNRGEEQSAQKMGAWNEYKKQPDFFVLRVMGLRNGLERSFRNFLFFGFFLYA